MGRLVVVSMMSVDGFYEGPHHDVSTVPSDSAFPQYNLERMKAADAVLLGAKSYEMFKGYWPQQETNPGAPEVEREFARLYRPIRKVVVSDSTEPPEEGHPWAGSVEIVRRKDAEEAVAGLKRAVAKDREIVTWGSRKLWTNLAEQGLVDEFHLVVGPGAIGDGTRTFDGLTAKFRCLEARGFLDSESALLRYEVR